MLAVSCMLVVSSIVACVKLAVPAHAGKFWGSRLRSEHSGRLWSLQQGLCIIVHEYNLARKVIFACGLFESMGGVSVWVLQVAAVLPHSK